MIYNKTFDNQKQLDMQNGFAVIGNMILDNFNLEPNKDMIQNNLVI